jgi:diguanylate cyclase
LVTNAANIRLDRRAWLRVYRATFLLTAAAVALSIIITNVIMETFSEGINIQGLMVAIVTPLMLAGPSIGFILFRQEQLQLANARLKELATYDWLTGCLNRGAFTHAVSQALSSAHQSTSALLVVDVDHFKDINDAHGHDRGDDALCLIAGTLKQTAGENVPVGRLGGEEFAVFLASSNNLEASRMAENLRAAVARLAFVTDGNGCPLSVSIGGAIFAGPADFRTLYRMADTCLYQAKSSGRDRVALIEAA